MLTDQLNDLTIQCEQYENMEISELKLRAMEKDLEK